MQKENFPPADSIPALVVSGFLGAGKTTLVRHLLKEAQREGMRLAVVSNEFGALGIDQALLGSQGSNTYVELEGGCVCCKLSDELVNTLQQLWEEVRPDRIVVETSGVALPFDTLINFWRATKLAHNHHQRCIEQATVAQLVEQYRQGSIQNWTVPIHE